MLVIFLTRWNRFDRLVEDQVKRTEKGMYGKILPYWFLSYKMEEELILSLIYAVHV